jgi:hypothetical protein
MRGIGKSNPDRRKTSALESALSLDSRLAEGAQTIAEHADVLLHAILDRFRPVPYVAQVPADPADIPRGGAGSA